MIWLMLLIDVALLLVLVGLVSVLVGLYRLKMELRELRKGNGLKTMTDLRQEPGRDFGRELRRRP